MVPWTVRDVILGIILVLFGVIVVALIYALATRILADDGIGLGTDLIIMGLAFGNIMFVVSWAMGPGQHGTSVKTLGLRWPEQQKALHLFLPFLTLVASLGFAVIYTVIVSTLGWDILEPDSLPDDIALGGSSVVFSFIIVALWGPLAEEVLFRGFIFPGLSGNIGFMRAAIITSLLFAVAHGSLGLIAPIFVTGMLLTWLYYETGSIWVSFAAHGIQNALAFSLSVWA